eukprot:PhM_4_TR2242/c0_g1_i1/m.22146/K14803/PTC2_3; protein phosphatase PTC2/3
MSNTTTTTTTVNPPRATRQRTYTTVSRSRAAEPTPTACSSIIHSGAMAPCPKVGCTCGEDALASRVTPYAAAAGQEEGLDFHKAFFECCVCHKRPAMRLCTYSWKGYCLEHAAALVAESPTTSSLFVSYDLSDFETMLWCGVCKTHAMCSAVEPALEKLFMSKGAFVDVPITDKEVTSLETAVVSVVACTMQGWRSNNEDAYCVHTNIPGTDGGMVFGVFDGHGGDKVAQFVANNFLPSLEKVRKEAIDGGYGGMMEEVLKRTFVVVDEAIAACGELEDVSGGSGTTACVVYIDKEAIYCANAGDARAVLAKRATSEVVELSRDHKPTDASERARIEAAGGRVSVDGRVDDVLAVSRAFGDFDFKQAASLPPQLQAVSCVPDVRRVPRSDVGTGDIIVVACDGVWDCKTSHEVGTELLLQDKEAAEDEKEKEEEQHDKKVCALLDSCVAESLENEDGIGTDNMSIVCIRFK